MKLSAYISRGMCFIAKFGNWKWLYDGIPPDAKWILNDREGKSVSSEDSDRACLENKNIITSHHFSDDRLMSTLIHRK